MFSPIRGKSGYILHSLVFFLFLVASELLSTDQRVNDDTGTTAQTRPAIAMNAYGQAVIVWQDRRDGVNDVYAQMIGHRGHFIKKNFKINDDGTPGTAHSPDAAINALGHFVLVWESRDDSTRIYAQKYAANGVKIGAKVRVDRKACSSVAASSWPVVGMDRSGRFVIAWTDMELNNGDILLQRFDRHGSPLGGNMRVNSLATGIQKDQAIAMAENGEFVIAWLDDRLSTPGHSVYEIFAQRYNASGDPLGGNIQISHSSPGNYPSNPAVALQPNGEFMVCWNYLLSAARISAASFDANGLALSKTFAVSDTVHSTLNISPDICCVNASLYGLVWKSSPGGEIVLRYTDRLGSLGPDAIALSDERGSESSPSLACSDKGFLVVFEDDVNAPSDIYAAWKGPETPINVYAGSGFAEMVPITWDAQYGRTDVARYRISRREGASPFTEVATIDLTARGPAGANMRDWIDTTVVAGHTYTYIAASIAGDDNNPSFPVAATPDASGHRISVPTAEIQPEIDGVLQPGEWIDAQMEPMGNPYAPSPVRLYLKYTRASDQVWLYLAVDDPNDEILDPGNGLGILFDLDGNGRWDDNSPSKEGMITINSAGATFAGYWGTYPFALGADTPRKAEGIVSKISPISGHLQYEAAINLNTSPLKITYPRIRAGFWITDPGNFYPTHYGNAGEWPLGALWECAQPLGQIVLTIPAVLAGAYDWPMARRSPGQSAWAAAESILRPPFNYTKDYGTGLGCFIDLASYDKMLFGTAKDIWSAAEPWRVHAFNIPTGQQLWSFELPNSWTWAATCPAVNDSLVLVGDAGSQNLYALGRRTGVLRWSKQLSRLEWQDPVIESGNIFIVCDSLYCLDAYNGRTIWHAPVRVYAAGILAVDQSRIYYADGTNLGCWDKATGAQVWSRENNGQTSVVVDEEKLYTFHDHSFYYRLKADGFLYWGMSYSGFFYDEMSNVLAVTDSFVCVRDPGYSDEMNIHLRDKRTSQYVWGKNYDSTYIAPPVIANNIVYLATSINKANTPRESRSCLQALDLATGAPVATYFDSSFTGEPIIAQHMLFISTANCIRAFSNTPIADVGDLHVATVDDFVLLQNYPNPFNPATTLRYHLDKPDKVCLRIYNAAGQIVKVLLQDYRSSSGQCEVHWDGRNDAGQQLASGVYIAHLYTNHSFKSLKILLLK